MKILLLQPPIAEKNITSFKYPPLGLITLAAHLKQNGHQVLLYDANVEKDSLEDILKLIKEQNPQIVGIGSMSVNINKTFKVAQAIKSYSSKIIIVAGGIHPTVEPEQTLNNPHVDFVVRGEGELTMSELTSAIEKGQTDLEKIPGLGFKKNNQTIINQPRELIKDIDSLPIPAYNLLPVNKYRAPYTSRTPYMIMIRSRGCPFDCTFCGVKKMFGRGFRVQSAERSIREVDYLIKELGVKEIGFKDSEFTLDPKNVEEFCDLLIQRKYDLTWNCNGRINHAAYPLLNKMKKAGCISITYGIESGDQQILANLKKQITLQQIRDAVKVSKEIGLKVIGNFMIGNPGDTRETIEKTINLAKELKLDYAYFGFTTPFPGTELREQAIANGWLLNESLDAIKYEDCIMNATSLATAELKPYLNRAYRSFYFRPSFIIKRFTKLSRNEIYNSIRGAFSIAKDALKKHENPTY